MRASMCSAVIPRVGLGLLVLAAAAGGVLTRSGTPLGESFIIVMASVVGGVEVARRATGPSRRIRMRITVVILVLVLVVGLIAAGGPPLIAVLGLLATADAVAGAARRLTAAGTAAPRAIPSA
ncbi:hypothetical protein GCM10022221_51670 [Actinocorallia aurea]